MTPSEISHLVQGKKIEGGGGRCCESVGFEGQVEGACFHVFEEGSVVSGSVRTEILQDGG